MKFFANARSSSAPTPTKSPAKTLWKSPSMPALRVNMQRSTVQTHVEGNVVIVEAPNGARNYLCMVCLEQLGQLKPATQPEHANTGDRELKVSECLNPRCLVKVNTANGGEPASRLPLPTSRPIAASPVAPTKSPRSAIHKSASNFDLKRMVSPAGHGEEGAAPKVSEATRKLTPTSHSQPVLAATNKQPPAQKARESKTEPVLIPQASVIQDEDGQRIISWRRPAEEKNRAPARAAPGPPVLRKIQSIAAVPSPLREVHTIDSRISHDTVISSPQPSSSLAVADHATPSAEMFSTAPYVPYPLEEALATDSVPSREAAASSPSLSVGVAGLGTSPGMLSRLLKSPSMPILPAQPNVPGIVLTPAPRGGRTGTPTGRRVSPDPGHLSPPVPQRRVRSRQTQRHNQDPMFRGYMHISPWKTSHELRMAAMSEGVSLATGEWTVVDRAFINKMALDTGFEKYRTRWTKDHLILVFKELDGSQIANYARLTRLVLEPRPESLGVVV